MNAAAPDGAPPRRVRTVFFNLVVLRCLGDARRWKTLTNHIPFFSIGLFPFHMAVRLSYRFLLARIPANIPAGTKSAGTVT